MTDAYVIALFTLAFTCWAGVVAWGVRMVTNQIRLLAIQQGDFVKTFNAYVTDMEHRVTRLEVKTGVVQS